MVSQSLALVALVAMFLATLLTISVFNIIRDILKKDSWYEVNRILYALLLVIFVEYFITQFPIVVYAFFLFVNLVKILEDPELWLPLFFVLVFWFITFIVLLYLFDFFCM